MSSEIVADETVMRYELLCYELSLSLPQFRLVHETVLCLIIIIVPIDNRLKDIGQSIEMFL